MPSLQICSTKIAQGAFLDMTLDIEIFCNEGWQPSFSSNLILFRLHFPRRQLLVVGSWIDHWSCCLCKISSVPLRCKLWLSRYRLGGWLTYESSHTSHYYFLSKDLVMAPLGRHKTGCSWNWLEFKYLHVNKIFLELGSFWILLVAFIRQINILKWLAK